MSEGAFQRLEALESPVAVSCLAWVLGIKLRPSGRIAVHVFDY